MNKFQLFILAAMFCGIITSSARSEMDIALKAGLSIPNLTSGSSGNPVSTGYHSRLDADVAVHFEYHISKRFSIQSQLEYSSQGGQKKGTQAFSVPVDMAQWFPPGQVPPYLYANYKSEAKMNYLMLPVLAKWHFNLNGRWGTYIAAGPFVSFLLGAKNITKGTSVIYLDEEATQPLDPQPRSFDSKDDVSGDLHNFNAGISGHIGLSYKLPAGRLFLEAGGNYGLIDIQKNSADGKNKTGAAAIDVGFQISL